MINLNDFVDGSLVVLLFSSTTGWKRK